VRSPLRTSSPLSLPLALGLAACAPTGSGATGGGGPAAAGAMDAGSASSSPAASGPEVVPALRRPTRRYFMSRTEDRCTVYFTDEDQISAPVAVPCPTQLANGERIRLAGKACLREGAADPAREVPVLCPDHLLLLEQTERARAR
jgi:hypothetical protein